MSLSTNKIIVNDDPVDENDIVNKRYVSNNFIKTTITPDDIPNTNLLDTNFNIVKTIYIWPYNRINSKKVPEGFSLMDY